LFLIEDLELESKYDAYKREKGGAFKMSIDEIRRIHYTGVGREEGREEGKEQGIEQLVLNQYKKGLDVEYIANINDLDINYVKRIVEKGNNKHQA
jgi:predicted transposase YdaD